MQRLKCEAGNKQCGKRCIPRTQKCRSEGEGKEDEKVEETKVEDPSTEKKPKKENPSVDKGNNTKRNLAIGASVLGVSAVALMGAGVATGKIKLPGQDAVIHAYRSRQPGFKAEVDNDLAGMKTDFALLNQEVTPQAAESINKLSEGFSGVQQAITTPGSKVDPTMSAGSLKAMAQSIGAGSKNAWEAVQTTSKASANLMIASVKEHAELVGADLRSMVDATADMSSGVGDNFKTFWNNLDDQSPTEIRAATVELAKKYMEGGRSAAASFVQSAAESAKSHGITAKRGTGAVASEFGLLGQRVTKGNDEVNASEEMKNTAARTDINIENAERARTDDNIAEAELAERTDANIAEAEAALGADPIVTGASADAEAEKARTDRNMAEADNANVEEDLEALKREFGTQQGIDNLSAELGGVAPSPTDYAKEFVRDFGMASEEFIALTAKQLMANGLSWQEATTVAASSALSLYNNGNNGLSVTAEATTPEGGPAPTKEKKSQGILEKNHQERIKNNPPPNRKRKATPPSR